MRTVSNGMVSQRVIQAVLLGMLHMVNALIRQSIATLVLFTGDVPYLDSDRVGERAAAIIKADLIFAYSQGYLWMQLPSGVIAQRVGCKPTYLGMLAALTVITCLIPSAVDTGATAFWFALFIAGFVLAPLTPVSGIVLSKWFPLRERSTGIAIRDAGSFVGMMLSLQFCPILADPAVLGWRNTYYFLGIVFLLSTVIYGAFAAESPDDSRHISDAERKDLCERIPKKETTSVFEQRAGLRLFMFPAVWAVVIAHGLDNFCNRGMNSYNPTYFKLLQVDNVAAGTYLATAELVAFLGRPVAALSDRMFQRMFLESLGLARCRKVFTCLAFSMTAGSLVVAVHVRQPLSVAAAFSAVNFASAFHTAGYRSSYLDQTTEYQGILMGLGNMLATIPATQTGRIVTYLAGAASTVESFGAAWYAVGVAQLVGALVFLICASDKCLDDEVGLHKKVKAG